MNARQHEIEQVRHGYTSDVYDDKNEAIILAHAVAQEAGYCFAIEGRFGWHCSTRKPSLRAGKVIECRDGKEFLA